MAITMRMAAAADIDDWSILRHEVWQETGRVADCSSLLPACWIAWTEDAYPICVCQIAGKG